MKKLLLTAVAAMTVPSLAAAEVKIGVILGFTGPIESLTGPMADASDVAFAEANASGIFLGGETVVGVRADSTCVDSAAATAAAEGLVADGVAAIMGADCSGVTGAILANVAVPNGVVMISPSATSPALTTAPDDGLFFRTAPTDARQGQILADMVSERGVTEIAVTYTNNDYGKGLADSFQANFEALGGTVTISAAHEDGKADYSAEVAALAAAGGEELAVFGYLDQGGKGIIQASIDTGAFDVFVMGDGMIGDSIAEAIGNDFNGSYGTVPGSTSDGAMMWINEVSGDVDGSAPFTAESYDAAALLVLAMQAAGSSDRDAIAAQVLNVSNGPGEKIYPGEVAKGLQILLDGGEIDYEGASNVNLIGPGEAAGSYIYKVVDGGVFTDKEIR
mgnify:CR=1 FL=1